jgi:hypothetical protein
MVARGYASLSFLHGAAEYINDLDVPTSIYHLGDFDPSGVNAGEKIEQTLREMAPCWHGGIPRVCRTCDLVTGSHPQRPERDFVDHPPLICSQALPSAVATRDLPPIFLARVTWQAAQAFCVPGPDEMQPSPNMTMPRELRGSRRRRTWTTRSLS